MLALNAFISEDATEVRLEFPGLSGGLQFTADELDEFIMALTEARSRMEKKPRDEPERLN